jgi:hypothetical protein
MKHNLQNLARIWPNGGLASQRVMFSNCATAVNFLIICIRKNCSRKATFADGRSPNWRAGNSNEAKMEGGPVTRN